MGTPTPISVYATPWERRLYGPESNEREMGKDIEEGWERVN
jgi:hypothetical protein